MGSADILGPGKTYTGFRTGFDAGVFTITLDRPDVGNALASEAIQQLGHIFAELANCDDVRVLLMRAEGPSFCAGGDVKGFATTLDTSPEARRADYWARMDRARQQGEAFIAFPMPVVVACQGAVAGAAVAFPLRADIALAEPGTRFVFPHQRLALPPDGGLSYLLPRVVGVRKATELALTAATIDASEALRIGIISRIVPAESLQAEAVAVAEKIARLPRQSARAARDLIYASLTRGPSEQLAAERDAVAEAVAGPEFVEGVRAFIEKRRPDFAAVTANRQR